jgi:putative aldouronate transport system substrate-binding protein
MKKSFIFIITTFFVISLLLSACGGNGKEAASNPASNEPSETKASVKPVEISLLLAGSGLPSPDKDVILQQLSKDLNMKLTITQVPYSDYDQQLNVKLAGGEPPDLFYVSKRQLFEYSRQGLLLDLTATVKKMSNLTAENEFSDAILKIGEVEGKQYAIPNRPSGDNGLTFWIRQDWLDKLKLPVPKTLDDLRKVAKAFVENDPDDNGKKDTFGITGPGYVDNNAGLLRAFFASFGVAQPGKMMIRDNKVAYSTIQPETAKAMEYINGMMKEGLFDPEFLNNKGLAHQEKAFKGQAGIVFSHWAHIKRPDSVEKMNAINPSQVWTQVGALTGPGGTFVDNYDVGNADNLFVISKTLEKNPQKLDKVIEYLNYISGGKGQLLVNYGIEGQHYKMTNGKVEVIPEAVAQLGYATYHQLTGRKNIEYLTARFGPQKPYYEFVSKQPYVKIYDGFVPLPAGINAADKEKYEKEEVIKFIFGKRPISEFPAFVNTLQTTYQLDKFTAEADKVLKGLGFIK